MLYAAGAARFCIGLGSGSRVTRKVNGKVLSGDNGDNESKTRLDKVQYPIHWHYNLEIERNANIRHSDESVNYGGLSCGCLQSWYGKSVCESGMNWFWLWEGIWNITTRR